jgi:hypothetical protein
MITDSQAEASNDFIRDQSHNYARAKAERVHLEHFRKAKRAILFQDAPDGTVADKEAYTYAHVDYISLLDAIKIAVEEEERLKYQLQAATLKIEIWRTQSSNNRAGM